MACITRFQTLPGKLRYHLCLLRHISVTKHYISYREVHVSACDMKSSSSEPKNKYLGNDIDFFGINEPKEQESHEKNVTRLSTSDKRYLQQLAENHSTQSRPPNVQLKSYGTVRYDRKIPKNESPLHVHVVHTPSVQRRKEKRSMRNAPKNKADTKVSTIILTEGGNEVHQISDINTNCPRLDTDSKTDLAFVNEQYFSYSKASNGENRNENIVLPEEKMSYIDSQYFDGDSNNVEAERGNTFNLHSSNDTPSTDTTSTESGIYFDKGPDESFIDKQYFTYDGICKENVTEPQSDVHAKNANITAKTKKCFDESLTEAEYRKEPAMINRVDTTRNKKTENLTTCTEQDLAIIDAQYFSYDGRPISIQNKISKQDKEQNGLQMSGHSPRDRVQRKTFDFGNFSLDKSESIAMDFEEYDTKDTNKKDAKLLKRNESMMNSKMGQQRKSAVDTPLDSRKEMAYDMSMKIRAEFEHKSGSNLIGKFDPKEYDSKGFRILSNQVPHFEYAPSIDIIKVLRNSIIYDQNDILAISKPYGLPSQGGPGVFHSVGSLLDQIIPKTQLYPIHRLDKETTGVMLFAKTEEMSERLSECFLKRIITKKYLVITKNIPQMKSGEIDIPVDEGTVEGKVRMCLRPYSSPQLSAVMKKRQPGMEAITRYRVLDQGKKCSLIECFPVTGKKHQIRVHLAFGLNCPVLGDHKYSHINKIAPMRLHPEILDKLNIQQSKVRYLAMHLHARSIMIPEFLSGRNLFISAPLPPHFVRNLKDLRLNLPPHT